MIVTELEIEAGNWPDQTDCRKLIERSLSAVCQELVLPDSFDSELSILLTDDEHIRVLNREWRNKDQATNVLSFPAMSLKPGQLPGPLLGDIILAHDTLVRESAIEGKPFDHHFAHLIVHGFLHLLGYDHENDSEAETMETIERNVLARLDIPDPY